MTGVPSSANMSTPWWERPPERLAPQVSLKVTRSGDRAQAGRDLAGSHAGGVEDALAFGAEAGGAVVGIAGVVDAGDLGGAIELVAGGAADVAGRGGCGVIDVVGVGGAVVIWNSSARRSRVAAGTMSGPGRSRWGRSTRLASTCARLKIDRSAVTASPTAARILARSLAVRTVGF